MPGYDKFTNYIVRMKEAVRSTRAILGSYRRWVLTCSGRSELAIWTPSNEALTFLIKWSTGPFKATQWIQSGHIREHVRANDHQITGHKQPVTCTRTAASNYRTKHGGQCAIVGSASQPKSSCLQDDEANLLMNSYNPSTIQPSIRELSHLNRALFNLL